LNFESALQTWNKFHLGIGFNIVLCVYVCERLGLNSGLHTFKAEPLLLKPHFQSILLWLFWRWSLVNLFAWAGLELFWSQPLKFLGLYAWGTGTQCCFFLLDELHWLTFCWGFLHLCSYEIWICSFPFF
jgi:hypothetical protein